VAGAGEVEEVKDVEEVKESEEAAHRWVSFSWEKKKR
jgi:hypothetical protein